VDTLSRDATVTPDPPAVMTACQAWHTLDLEILEMPEMPEMPEMLEMLEMRRRVLMRIARPRWE
jgi:hypothetical protein